MPDTLADDEFGFGSSGAVPAFFVVSVSGLTTNSTYGQTAQIGTPLYASAHHFSGAAPVSVAWKWHDNAGEIAGATSAAYTPVPGDNLENIYPTATPLGYYVSQAGPAHTVRFAAPVLAGGLPHVSYSRNSGDRTVPAASGFSGENLIYSIQTDIPGVAVEASTGIVTIPTVAEVNGAVTVTATNSGGAAQNTFEVEVVDDVVTGPPFTVGVGGLTGGIARIGTTVSAEIMWNIPAGEVLRYRWRSDGDVIPGARSQTYQVDEAYDGTELSVTIKTVEDGAKTTDRYPVQYEAPEAVGTLSAMSYAVGSGEQTVNAAADFTGAGILYSVDSPIAGVSIDSSTGIVTIPTGTAATGRITVTATNSGGAAQSAFEVSIANPDRVPDAMSAPSVTAAGPTSLRVDLAAAPQDGGSPILSYDLHVSDGDGTPTIIREVSDPAVVTDLTPDTVYEVRTRAVNAIGAAQWSPGTSASTTAVTVGLPEIVINTGNTVDIMVDEGTFTVTVSGSDDAHHHGTHGPFTASDLDDGPISAAAPVTGGAARVGETLTALPGLWLHDAGATPTITGKWHRNGVDIPGATGSTYVVTETDGGETITYVEMATNAAGSRMRAGNGIVIPVATVPGSMAAPTVAAVSDMEIRVDLAEVPDDGGAMITRYDLRYSDTDGSNWATVTGVSTPEVITDLTAETLYYVQTRAVNAVGAGAWSVSANVATDQASSGLNFADDFSAFALGETVGVQTPYTVVDGFDGVYIRDDQGTRVARQEGGGSTTCTYTENPVANDREVTLTIKGVPDIASNPWALYLSYADKGNYVRIFADLGGYVTVQQRVSGTNTNFYQSKAVGAGAGDTLKLSLKGTSLTAFVNTTQLGGTYTITSTALADPGFKITRTGIPTDDPSISRFSVKEL